MQHSAIQRLLDGETISPTEALDLYRKLPLAEIGSLATAMKERLVEHPDVVTYIVDRNINHTNICNADCIFCAFYRKPGDEEGYVLTDETLFEKIQATIDRGGRQILLQGGHNPDLGITYYEDLFRRIKSSFDIRLHALSPSEVVHITEISKISMEEVLDRLIAAGLDSIPGGGAEILVDRVRKRLMRHKASSDQWLRVMELAHERGLRTTATMMFGHIETLEDRLEHLLRLRELQAKTGGFTAFIGWTFQKANTGLEKGNFRVAPAEYLRMVAFSRLILNNFVNIQSSFVTMGSENAALALHFGANDFGSVMIEENVVRSAGAENPLTEAELRACILGAGFRPQRRNMEYTWLEEPAGLFSGAKEAPYVARPSADIH